MTLTSSEDICVASVFPSGMKNSELVLQDEEGNSVVTELDELSCVSEENITPTAINVENSKDVIIGPVTQFHGPVTVYQNVNGISGIEHKVKGSEKECYLNGKLVKSESSSSDTSHTPEKSNKSFPYSQHLKFIGIPLLLILIASLITCAVILTTGSKQKQRPHEQTTPRHTTPATYDPYTGQEDGDGWEPIGSGAIIDRELWHGLDPLNFTKPLKHPTALVVVGHTVTPFCDTFLKCSKRVRSIQEYHMNDLGSPDIGYNFLIGGDANVYVGRGWDVMNFYGPDSIGICFIGNYINDHLNEAMINSTKALLAAGIRAGKLSMDYKLIGHNQTYATLSPGRNVYKEIKTWPHFDGRSYMPKKE